MIKNTFAFLVCTVALFAATELSAQSRSPSLLRSGAASRARRSAEPPANEAQSAAADEAQSGDAAEPKEAPALNWDAAPVDIVLQTYAEQIDKTILKDPAAPTPTITLKTREGQKLTKEEYLEAIEVVLEMNGIHLEPYGERFIRALPRKDVRKEGIPLIMDPETKLGDTGRVVSMMIPFKNIGTEEAQKALEGFKSNSGILLVFERTNSILVTDTEQNINRMLEIARSIDIATPVLENVFVRQVKNASAQDIKTALEAIVQESQKELEKNGKAANNQNASPASTLAGRPMPRLLNSRNPNANQPVQPVNNESLVMSVSDADRGMIRGKVLILADERSNKLIIVTQKANMDFFDRVIEQLDVETTPDTVVKVYRLKYAEAEEVSDMINDLIGNSSSSSTRSGQNQNANAKSGSGGNLTRSSSQASAAVKKSANQRSGDAKAGELTKENTTVLADKRINGIVVMTEKELVPTIEQIIESMDVKLSQVLIETVIIEVTLGDDLKTGIDWVKLGRGSQQVQVKGPHGVGMSWYTDSQGNIKAFEDGKTGNTTGTITSSTLLASDSEDDDSDSETTSTTWTRIGSVFESAAGGLWSNGAKGFALGGGAGEAAGILGDIVMGSTTNILASSTSGGLNYFLKSDRLNLGAVIQASKSDSRTKYIASPIVMTVDNKEATIDATENRQFLTGWSAQSGSYGNSGQPTPNYSAKDIGIKLKITPKINPNGTVMLTVEEEYSQFHENGQSMLIPENGVYKAGFVDLAVERKMSADILLDNMQTVVLGGLTETVKAESESGIPILKDIPWIGKWLFGSVKQSEGRKELLVFMTPYVLDDGDMAQAEALRRKKSLSDARPWEDHGWSASELADPVSKKEQMRRLKDEWKKQDEERKTKLAIESEKIKRAKALEAMSEEERKFWLEMHMEELQEEQRKELEKKMLDPESQDMLRELIDDVRERKQAEANAALDKAEQEAK